MYRYNCSTCRQPHASTTEPSAQDHQVWHHRTAHQADVPPRERVYFRREPQRARLRYLIAPFALGLLLMIISQLRDLFT